jgi:hypothetical protein
MVKVDSDEALADEDMEALRFALRVSPLREPEREGDAEAEAERKEDALGGAEGRAENVAVVEGEYVKSGARSRIPK